MTGPQPRLEEFGTAVDIPVPARRVWTAMTERIDGWWRGPIRQTGCQAVQLDLRIGGHLWEDHGGGAGRALGRVVEVRPGRRLRLDGDLGDPATLTGTLTLEVTPIGDASCRVTGTVRRFGTFTAEHETRSRQAWADLLDRLRQQVSGTSDPATGPSGR